MAIVTFWNDNTGKIGQTHSAIAIAAHMAIEHNYKILLMSTGYKDNVIRQAFGIDDVATKLFGKKNNSMELEGGIESMSKMVAANRINPEIIPTFTRMIYKDRLEVLSGPRCERIDYDRIYATCKNIINVSNAYYDVVFVDLNHGLEGGATRAILNSSNIIVLNIEQKTSEIEKVKELKHQFPNKSVLTLMNKYDRESKYSLKNFSRELSERKEILSVPYNLLYAESVQEGTVADLFINPRIRKLSGTEDKNAFFISELKRTAGVIDLKIQEIRMMGR